MPGETLGQWPVERTLAQVLLRTQAPTDFLFPLH